ncbi:transcriptional regulator, effector-binding domain/component [Xenococcus sp. PCC 7305]|uniref:GyrI-like domain-containing protein n=1 Tax=Xenococcus sp. PCC 7305 TaxID=102125 RepID=UPI0002ABDE21|nr:GyrI-like domain-containing protein [Xenococcus sp. PCC 7305]ELS01326.1 transcriptional regulator, effector-binding domain/component [Xenococcus sp. PCC 7305]
MSDAEKVVLKAVETQWIAATLGVIPNYRDSGPILNTLFTKAFQYAQENKVEIIGSPICIYHDNTIRESNIPIETIIPIAQEISANEEVWVYQLPKVNNMASIVHKGSFATIEKVYDILENWIKDNNYQINGSLREIYIVNDQGGDNSVTEIQYPVEKIKNKKNFFSWLLSLFNNRD